MKHQQRYNSTVTTLSRMRPTLGELNSKPVSQLHSNMFGICNPYRLINVVVVAVVVWNCIKKPVLENIQCYKDNLHIIIWHMAVCIWKIMLNPKWRCGKVSSIGN